jgi:selenide,water dikinase
MNARPVAGASAVLRETGCALVGGHTSDGAELSLGFAVNGLVARDNLKIAAQGWASVGQAA